MSAGEPTSPAPRSPRRQGPGGSPEAPRRDLGLRLFLRAVVARAYPRIVGQQRQRAWLFFDTFLPLVATAGYVFAYRAMHAPEDYVGFAVVGGAMTAFWINVMWNMSAQLYWDKESGNLPLYIMSPTPLMGILLGMALGGIFATTLRAAVILLLGTWLFQIHFSVSSFLELFAVFTLTMASLYGLGMLLGSVFLFFGRGVWQLTKLLHEPVYFIAGFYFPVKSLGFAAALAASALPLTLGLDAIRQLVFLNGQSQGFLSVRAEIGALAALTVIFIGAAKYALMRMERLSIQEGTLMESRL